MRSLDEETWYERLILLAGLLAWVLAMLLVALLTRSFALTMIGLLLVNVVALRIAWRFRVIPGGQDTEWAEARPVPHPTAPSHPRHDHYSLPPTRPLRLGDPPPQSGAAGAVATARQTYIYDN